MGSLRPHDMYSQIPLSVGDNRDENILIEVLGNWIPECDLMFYGLMNSKYSEILYKLKNTKIINPKDIYREYCYFTGDDFIKYLYSDSLEMPELPEELLVDATKEALDKYLYVPCNETMLRHSMIELAFYDWIKSITLIYPWDIREIDYEFLKTIIPHSVLYKFRIVSGELLDFIKTDIPTGIKYTTIVLNSLSDLNELIDNNEEYHTDETFFLLRNSSENVSFTLNTSSEGERSLDFKEIGTEEVLLKLIDEKTLLPKTKMRFARYEPFLFSDAKPDPNEFKLGR